MPNIYDTEPEWSGRQLRRMNHGFLAALRRHHEKGAGERNPERGSIRRMPSPMTQLLPTRGADFTIAA